MVLRAQWTRVTWCRAFLHPWPSEQAAFMQTLQLPAVAGMHVMPVSKAGRRLATLLAEEDKLFKR